MANLNRVQKILVTNVTGANTGTGLTSIVDGDILVLNSKMADLTGTPTPSSGAGNEAIYLAQGKATAGQFLLSSKIVASKVTSWRKLVYQAPVEQTTHIGYNETDGALSLDDGAETRLRIVVKDQHRFLPHAQTAFDYYYTSGTTADNFAAAQDFAKKINADKRQTRAGFVARVTGNGALTELAADTTVTNGSKDVASAGHGMSAGDYFVANGGDTGRGDYYTLASATTNAFVLNRSYGGVTEIIAVGTSVDDAASSVAPSSVGISIEAQVITTRTHAGGTFLDYYQQVQFGASLGTINSAAGAEEQARNTVAVPGQGFWEQIRDIEFDASGRLGISNKTLFPIDNFVPLAVSGNQYDLYVIEHYNEINTGQGVSRDPITTMIAFESSTATKMDAIEAILDSWMVGAGLPAIP